MCEVTRLLPVITESEFEFSLVPASTALNRVLNYREAQHWEVALGKEDPVWQKEVDTGCNVTGDVLGEYILWKVRKEATMQWRFRGDELQWLLTTICKL